jgi:predicted membrane channel-forming protein YqfA (hemolysin III family)
MTHNKKAATHVVGLILALVLFVYAGKRASHDLTHWGGIALGALIAALVLTAMIHVAFGAEAARHRRPRFPALLRRMGGRRVGVAKLT